MRSIRRSLLCYLLLLLVLALGGVMMLVDRFAQAAMLAREQAEARRIEDVYKTRWDEEEEEFDSELLTKSEGLVRELRQHLWSILATRRDRESRDRPATPLLRRFDSPLTAPDGETTTFAARVALLPLGQLPLGHAAVTAAGVNTRPNVYPQVWSEYDAPRALGWLRDSLKKAFDDEDHTGYFQLTLIVSRPGHPEKATLTVRPARVETDLSFDPSVLERHPRVDHVYDEVEVPGSGRFRRVVRQGRNIDLWLPPPPGIMFFRQPARRPDMVIRVYVHALRPRADLAERLASEQQDRDEQLAQVRAETRPELVRLRTRFALIGGASFLALVIGGWVIVARGLGPLRKLSDAVSRVSEKDFRLPVTGEELSWELAPVHARLNQTLELLRRAFEREKQAVADISHELRTPIASLLATIDVALRRQRTPDQYRATLEDCRAIAKQLGQLVERIMTLASLDEGSVRTAATRTDAADLASRCGELIRPLAEAHGLSFNLIVSEPVELDTDQDKLREVLMNLLHNGVEYNRPGGTLELFVRRGDDAAVFEVRDTGIGMTDEVRGKIFERFFRADPSRHATGVHAGLGLAIVKEYVERLNGTISVQSQPDVGTTFLVTLPVALADQAEVPDQITPPHEQARPDRRARGEMAQTGT